jgi:hypothetical protein
MMRQSKFCRVALSTLLSATMLLSGGVLTGCKTNPADLYRTGYDKMLTPQNWAGRRSDDAVVIIGGYPSVWQKAGEPSYAFEARQRFSIDWTRKYDVALVKAGTYQLQTIVLGGGDFAAFGGFQGLGAASGPVIASFAVGAGEVVYVGDLDAEVLVEGIANCAATLTERDSSKSVAAAFRKQVPYVEREPKTSLMTIQESLIRFPCGQAY